MSSDPKDGIKRALRRQASWLEDSLLWIFRTKVLTQGDARPTGLDVGSGPGFVMDTLSKVVSVSGLDIDPDMARACSTRGLRAVRGSAYELPFVDSAFDVVYCTFLLMWLDRPERALEEMKRVSRRFVLCLAEPDYGGRIDYPLELGPVRAALIEGLGEEGAEPLMGRRLREIYRRCGLNVEIGVHPGTWSLERLRQEYRDEWNFVENHSRGLGRDELAAIKRDWERALKTGTLFQYNPIFCAIGEKQRAEG